MSTQTTAATRVVPRWTYGDKLRKARSHINMDQREFATALGVSAGSLAGWETNRTKPRNVVAIAKRVEMVTHIPASWLLGLDEPEPTPEGPDGPGLPRKDSNLQPSD